MENQQLPQQRAGGESRREYKSPVLRKLGKLSDVTLSVNPAASNLDGMAGKVTPSV
jgi:hypothetical protein